MKCFAYYLISNEAIAFKKVLQQEAELTRQNVVALIDAKIEIEAMLRGAI